ncbi:MAG: retropepsin-like domain-containing protein [Elusimicrobia bacterium]|nr:retropepsin-like domain-containing protein [Elusimicrobiota bacterium]
MQQLFVPSFFLDPSLNIIPVRVELIGKRGTFFLRMALDTGATHTIVPPEVLAAIGCDPSKSRQRIEISTASGVVLAPLVPIDALRCLGYEVKRLAMLAHALPQESPVRGLLGLDFLKHFNIYLKFRHSALEISV